MKKKKFPVFWCVFAAVVVLGIIAVQILTAQLRNFLGEYEASRPKYAAEAVFNENFRDFDPYAYLEKCNNVTYGYETRERVAEYLREKTQGKELSYYSVSSDEKDVYRYSVKADNVKIASFELRGKKEEGARYETYEAAGFEIFFAAADKFSISVPAGYSLRVNGMTAGEDCIAEKNIPDESVSHMPEGVDGLYYDRYELSGFVTEPELAVYSPAQVSCRLYERNGQLYACPEFNDSLKDKYSDYVIEALQKYAVYMQYNSHLTDIDFNKLSVYFDPQSKLYRTIKTVDNIFVNIYNSYDFENVSAEDFIAYDDNTFSCRVLFDHVLHRNGEEDYVDEFDMTVYLRRVWGKYLIYDMIRN